MASQRAIYIFVGMFLLTALFATRIGASTKAQLSMLMSAPAQQAGLASASADSAENATEIKLLASDRGEGDYFGYSVSLSGQVALVGAAYDDTNGFFSGAAYIYRWTGGYWREEAKLSPSDGETGDWFGYSVSVGDDVVLIGARGDNDKGDASGSAYIYRWDGESWQEEAKLTATDGAENDFFGSSVAISGDVAVVGAFGHDQHGTNAGAAYVYHWDGSGWQEKSKLLPSDWADNDSFGRAVSVSGDVILVGAKDDDDQGSSSGSAYLFRWNGSDWTFESKLLASDGTNSRNFGTSVSINGQVALVGAVKDNYSNAQRGSAYIYRFDGSSWLLESKLVASDAHQDDFFGSSVSISSDRAIVGAFGNDSLGEDSGAAYIFRWNGEEWEEETKLLATDGTADEQFGRGVAIDGQMALVGSPKDDDQIVGIDAGAAYLYNLSAGTVPDIMLPSSSIGDEIVQGIQVSDTFMIKNQGTSPLQWQIEHHPDWLSVDRAVGLVAPEGTQSIVYTFDTTNLPIGVYSGSVTIVSNDPDEVLIELFVLLRVMKPISEIKFTPNESIEEEQFGRAVAINGDMALIGAPGDNQNLSGAVYVYRRNGEAWIETGNLLASDGALEDYFGYSVGLSGEVAIIGAYGDDDNGEESGSAYIFRFDGQNWQQEAKLLADDGAKEDYFGRSVSISGNLALVGAYKDDDSSWNSGAVYVYRWNGNNWFKEAKLLATDGDSSDYFGYSVSASGDVALIGAYRDDDRGGSSGSAYIYRWNGSQWTFESKLTASDGHSGDQFGRSLFIEGNLAIIGAPQQSVQVSDSGAAYLFRWNGSRWVEEAKLFARDREQNDYFGSSVSLSYDEMSSQLTLLVGASGKGSGAAYLLTWDGNDWQEEVRMMAVDGIEDDYFGSSVSLDGNLALVGAREHDNLSGSNVGAVYLYNLSPEMVPDIGLSPSYLQGGTLTAAISKSSKTFTIHNTGREALTWSISEDEEWFSATPSFGTLAPSERQSTTIEIDATHLMAGLHPAEVRMTSNDPDEPLLDVPLLTRVISPTTELKLSASDGSEDDNFGSSVSISGDVAVVGAYRDSEIALDSGAAYIYRWNGKHWQEEAKLLASDGSENHFFGSSVSVSGELVIVGAPDYGSPASSAAYIYRLTGTDWQEEAKLLSNSGTPGSARAVAISGNKAVVGANETSYVYRWDGNSWLEEARLTASDGATENSFGASVSIHGDYVLIGAYTDDEHGWAAGAVYIYHWNGQEWQAEAKLFPKDGANRDGFGRSVAIDGEIALIGADGDDDNGGNSGSAYIYRWDGSRWNEEAKLLAHDGGSSDSFGYSVALNGKMAAVGAYWNDNQNGYNAGAAYLFAWDGNSWQQITKLIAHEGPQSDKFARSVALGEKVALIGSAEYSDKITGLDVGAAYLYNLSAANVPDIALSSTSQQVVLVEGTSNTETLTIKNSGYQTLTWSLSEEATWVSSMITEGILAPEEEQVIDIIWSASDLSFGRYEDDLLITTNDPDEPSPSVSLSLRVIPRETRRHGGDWTNDFGRSLSISGEFALVGAPDNLNQEYGLGAAYLYRLTNNGWQQEASLLASDGEQGDGFGSSVSISGNMALVGAIGDDDQGSNSGAAYLFRWTGNEWQEEAKLTPHDGSDNHGFGKAVSISDEFALIGATGDDENGSGSGSVYVYKWTGQDWQYQSKLLAHDGNREDFFGISVSLSGNVALVGALGDDDQVTFAGAAYLFRWNGAHWQEEAKLTALEPAQNDRFGRTVSVDGDVAIVGMSRDYYHSPFQGTAHIYRWNGRTWVFEAELTPSDGSQRDRFGSFVSISDDIALVAAPSDNDNGYRAGSVYLFRWTGSSWIEEGKILTSDGDEDNQFGYTLGISGNQALITDSRYDSREGTHGLAYFYSLPFGEASPLTTSEPRVSLIAGEDESITQLTIANPLTEPISWQLNWEATWLNATPLSGTLAAGEQQSLTITIDTSNLALGNYRDTLIITTPDSSSLKLPIWLTVVAPFTYLPIIVR